MRQTGSGNRGGHYDVAGHDLQWYVINYNTECILECMSVEKCVIPQIGGYQRVPMGPWSPVLGITVYTYPFVVTSTMNMLCLIVYPLCLPQ